MNDRPTPDTDAVAAYEGNWDTKALRMTAHARKLERERDEAREKLEDWENAAAHVEADHPDEVHCGCVPVLRKLLTDARQERDEAREELARIESLLLDPHAVYLNFLHGKIAKLDWEKLEHIHGPRPARQAPAWIPVSQALPDDDMTVLVHMADGEVWTGFVDAEIWRYVSGDRIDTPVLHWRPFPDPPRP